MSRTPCWTHPCAVLLQCLEVEKQTIITEKEELLSSHAMSGIANMTCSGLTLQLWDFLPHTFKGSAVNICAESFKTTFAQQLWSNWIAAARAQSSFRKSFGRDN